jgi:hypothetical protein
LSLACALALFVHQFLETGDIHGEPAFARH